MSSDLKERIYEAQCLGNVQPIEHMVPYPNLRALVDGQNIKYGEKLVYADKKLTSDNIYSMAQQTANWLFSMGITPNDRILVETLPFPQNEILAFGIWTLGASMVLTGEQNLQNATQYGSPSLVINAELDYFEKIKKFPIVYNPIYKPLLADEAMVFWKDGKGIKLSHYNLLVNANGIQHAIDLFEDQTFHVNLEPKSMAWVILQVILPLYSGAPLTSKKPDIRLGEEKGDFIIKFQWKELKNTNPPSLYILNENTAFISVNKTPLHLTGLDNNNNPSKITGHSVMMGYTDDKLNDKVFNNNSLNII
jgi:hypothetical protein